jgi:cytochrome c peroxidase
LKIAGSRSAVVLLAILCLGSLSAGGAQLSSQAQLGKRLFFDPRLSASGALSCASCHDPAYAYAAPPDTGVVMRGGAGLDQPGLRSVPSLRYLSETPRFARHAYVDRGAEREDVGPAGGLMMDGRADGLRAQALLPLLNPQEMANSGIGELARRLRRVGYAVDIQRVFGTAAADAQGLAEQAAAALERFELEDPSFHPYSSRYDQYLRGAASLSAAEIQGLRLFIDPAKGNCADCHTISTGPQDRAPDFTDYSFHALGVPRNPAIPATRDPGFFDLGLCGPVRTDMRVAEYCGFFKTPTLRNTARRRYFFHNGRFTSLLDVLHFYAGRDTDPRRWYPSTGGEVKKFDDLPAQYRANVEVSDAPLDRRSGDAPALNDAEIRQLIAFLGALNDAD